MCSTCETLQSLLLSHMSLEILSCVSHTAFVHNTVSTAATLQLHTLPCLYVLKLVALTWYVYNIYAATNVANLPRVSEAKKSHGILAVLEPLISSI